MSIISFPIQQYPISMLNGPDFRHSHLMHLMQEKDRVKEKQSKALSASTLNLPRGFTLGVGDMSKNLYRDIFHCLDDIDIISRYVN